MLEKELVKEWTIGKLLEGREFDNISKKIIHVSDVNIEAKKINPLRENSDAIGCVEYVPNSRCDLKILIQKELYENIGKATYKQDNNEVVEVSMCYRLQYVETLAHECTHYFELINLYRVLSNGICNENNDIRLMRQFSEYSAKKTGYKFYFMALDHFNAFDTSCINCELDNWVRFYNSLQNIKLEMPIFLYHQIRLLATISAWNEYYDNDRAERKLSPFLADTSVKDDLLNCLSINLEKISKEEVVAVGNDFMEILNNSSIFH